MRLGSYLEEMYDIDLSLDQEESGHFDEPLVEHHQAMSYDGLLSVNEALNLQGHDGSLYDDLHHEDYFPHDEHE